jgi:LysR family transcriptional regulator, transcriptional activator of the cysJI operon
MQNFRLRVFHTVATHLSFSKAADLLFISQPAVTKNIKELESEWDVRLFDRMKGRISITEAGKTALEYATMILQMHDKLEFALSSLKNKFTGKLRLGASTTIGQYVLPELLAKFNAIHPDVDITLANANSQQIESAILSKQIDLGLVEGNTNNPQLKYIPFLDDEIVAIASTSQPVSRHDEISIETLKQIPVVLREDGSGSLEIISKKLLEKHISLNELRVVMHLGSTESIKSYIQHANCIGLISIHSVNKDLISGNFKVIDIADLSIERTFHFVHLHGPLGGLGQLFMEFAQRCIANGYVL